MISAIFWEPIIVVFCLGALGALLTWRPQKIDQPPMKVSLVPALFLGIGTTPYLYHDHTSGWIPAAVLLPAMILRPGRAVFLEGVLPMALASLAWWCLLTACCKRWRRKRGLA